MRRLKRWALRVVLGLAVVLVAGAGIGWFALQKLRHSPRLFDASVAELAKDRHDLTSGS